MVCLCPSMILTIFSIPDKVIGKKELDKTEFAYKNYSEYFKIVVSKP